jgi:hypothetical protein
MFFDCFSGEDDAADGSAPNTLICQALRGGQFMAYRDHGNEEEYENYWNSGKHGNKEDYEAYLLIKSRLEGKAYRPSNKKKGKDGRKNSLLSFYPRLKWIFSLLLFIYVTQIVEAYLEWGLRGRFLGSAFYWGVVFAVTYWYFIRRNPGNGSVVVLERIFPNVSIPDSLPYWAFLLGCLLASLDLNDIKIWIRGIEHLSYSVGKPLSVSSFFSLSLPRIPFLLKLLANFSILFSGGLLLFDAIASRATK